MRGEKSNAMIAESQVDYHVIDNGGGGNPHQNHCLFCDQAMGAINLPEAGLGGAYHPRNNEIYYRAKCVFYEPVLIEPLTFTNGAEFNPPHVQH